MNELDDVGVEAVSVFLQETWKKDGERSIKDGGGGRLDLGPRLWGTLPGTDQAGCIISIFK